MKDVQLISAANLKKHVFRGEFSQFSKIFQLILENPILVILLLMLVVLGLILSILWPPISIAVCVRVTHMGQCMLELSHIIVGAAKRKEGRDCIVFKAYLEQSIDDDRLAWALRSNDCSCRLSLFKRLRRRIALLLRPTRRLI